MDLVIDIGNTLQKLAVFDENGEIIRLFLENTLTLPLLQGVLAQYPVKRAIVSSVGRNNDMALDWLATHTQLVRFSHECRLPITLKYATPETLGTDRIANAVGANTLYPHRNVLSIMAGTCLVADFVNADGEYLGGSISPGLRMRFQALEHYTAKLPFVEPENIDYFIGDTTQKSILSGIINGISAEIDGLIDRYSQSFDSLIVISKFIMLFIGSIK